MKTEEQIATFMLYSMFVYPVTNYLVSPSRDSSKWRGVIYATAFLAVVTFLQLSYDMSEEGDSLYGVLQTSRDAPAAAIRRAYKRLALELHPDKNKSPQAAELYQRVKLAHEVLSNPEGRSVYDRLGFDGIRALAHGVVDAKFTIVHLLIKYCSSMFFTFMMTMSDSSGQSLMTSVFVLSVILYIELLVTTSDIRVPAWLLPHSAPFELVGMLHKLYPTFMNGLRCILGALRRPEAGTKAGSTLALIEDVRAKWDILFNKMIAVVKNIYGSMTVKDGSSNALCENPESLIAIMARRAGERCVYSRGAQKDISDMQVQLEFYKKKLAFSRPTQWDRYYWIWYLVIYVVLWAAFRRYVVVIPPVS